MYIYKVNVTNSYVSDWQKWQDKLSPKARRAWWSIYTSVCRLTWPTFKVGYQVKFTVKSYSWSQNQISTEVEAKFDIGLLISLTDTNPRPNPDFILTPSILTLTLLTLTVISFDSRKKTLRKFTRQIQNMHKPAIYQTQADTARHSGVTSKIPFPPSFAPIPIRSVHCPITLPLLLRSLSAPFTPSFSSLMHLPVMTLFLNAVGSPSGMNSEHM